ncbi:MAG TPA: tRNA pseudouridine(55) synthase TruB [Gaiellales bacterium]|jgi:tRNA pseudouridine55 synthase|nr:tRNA pseudouridine(55) synthase TruB [Gaiellales bacterium]
MTDANGLVLVDKPAGPSSFAVLRSLRPALGRKLGHAGTLDPFATGLLLVLAGRATRLATFLSGLDKRYRATVQFGATSTTLDPEGELTRGDEATDEEAVRRAAADMVGELDQRVPAASAVHIEGERAYRRLRRGETVEIPSRRVRIDALEVRSWDARSQRAEIEIACSKGTYVRQVAADLGEATAAGAYCLALRRLAVGPFSVDRAAPPERIREEPGQRLIPPARALPHLAAHELAAEERSAISHGQPISCDGHDGATVALVAGGELLAVARGQDGQLRPLAVFA